MVVSWIFFAALLGMVSSLARAGDREYAVAQTFALQRRPNGLEGTVQLLMDKRLTGPVREELWGKGDWSFVFPHESEMYKEFSALPPAKAKLRIKDGGGKLLAERNLETPLAELEMWHSASDGNECFLLTEDYSVGAGSYNGLRTTLVKVSDYAFHDVEALNIESQQQQSIRLVKSLKSDWQITSRESGGEILSVSCHPKNDGSFVVDYVRYSSFDGSKWLEYKREVDGFWESDQPFPGRSAFP
jgi:hypothetical protein